MIVQCEQCKMYFEDEYRSTICPHEAFPANDGANNFEVHEDAYLKDFKPRTPIETGTIMTSIGATCARLGLTDLQKKTVRGILQVAIGEYKEVTLHQGCCEGGDVDITRIAFSLGLEITGYPSNHTAAVDQLAKDLSNNLMPVKPPLDRNYDIVNACELLVACPKSTKEETRSGTWHTVRYARKRMNGHGLVPAKIQKIIIVWPDGTTTEEVKE